MNKKKVDLHALTVKEIEQVCENSHNLDRELLEQLAGDPRAGVRKLYKRYSKKNAERQLLDELLIPETSLRQQSFRYIAGVDEAGRGPLAGPVVAAAVILPGTVDLPGLNDSKKMTARARQKLSLKIKETAIDWSVGLSTVSEILCYNIHWASLMAMNRAVYNLGVLPEYLLVDGYALHNMDIPQERLVGGDGKSASIAAASVIAKVARDELMGILHRLYPRYGFDRNKGYGTGEHIRALEKYGASPVHRKDFAPVKKVLCNGQ